MTAITKRNVLINSFEVEFPPKVNFLQVRETLTRIGVSSKVNGVDTIYPSVVLLQKRDKYYLVHFKMMFALDGGVCDMTETDWERYHTIVSFIESWGLVKIVDEEQLVKEWINPRLVKIVKYSEKDNWEVIHKYVVGNPDNRRDEYQD